MTVFYQKCVTKKRVEEPSFDIDSFSRMNDLYAKISDYDGIPHVIFCSIQKANAILRDSSIPGKSHLASGLFYDKSFLDYNVYSTQIPEEFLLNNDYVLLPWYKIAVNVDGLISIFGQSLFIRPNSSQKQFTGFSKTGKEEILFEIHALQQTENIRPETICVISSAKEIDPIEYRFWIVGSKLSTWAPYHWHSENVPDPNHMSEKVFDAATRFAQWIGNYQETIVVDFCVWKGFPKLVECNAVSTSGWYEGMDHQKLVKDLKDLGGF